MDPEVIRITALARKLRRQASDPHLPSMYVYESAVDLANLVLAEKSCECELDPEEIDRRERMGEAALRAGSQDFRANDDETNLVDVLANIMHAAAKLGLDFESAAESAAMHVRDERPS